MNNEDEKVFCTKCGEPMKSSSRCCLKCGNLNPMHKDNQNYFETLAEIHGNTYTPPPVQGGVVQPTIMPQPQQSVNSHIPQQVVSNQTVPVQSTIPNPSQSEVTTVIPTKDNSTSFLVCNIVNGVFLLLDVLFMILILASEGISSSLGIAMALMGATTLMLFGLQVFYLEMGKSWWAVFVPLYGNMVLSDIAMGNMLIGLLTLIPVIGEIAIIVILYNLGDKIGKSGIMTVLFFPIIAALFGFNACSYVCGNKTKDSVNRFLHKGIYYISFIAFIGGILMAIIF